MENTGSTSLHYSGPCKILRTSFHAMDGTLTVDSLLARLTPRGDLFVDRDACLNPVHTQREKVLSPLTLEVLADS